MATKKATWDDLVKVVRGLTNLQERLPVCGTFTIHSEADITALKACLEAEDDTHLFLVNEEDVSNLEVGQSVEVSVEPRLGFGLLKRDINGLLTGPRKARIEEPSFFLMGEGLSNKDFVDDDHPVARYRAVLSLIQTLKKSAAFLDPEEPSLVFIQKGKFDVRIEYNANDLANMSLPVIREIVNIIPSDTHEKQCASIFAEAVISLTWNLPNEKRFAYLIAHAAELKEKFEQSYKLFVAGFSYEKIRDQVEAARIEYIGKIHKIFSDIQNQVLGIPIATIIVATQMKDAKTYGYEFWGNTAVLVGCWVFSLLMAFLICNQSHTLTVLSNEVHRQKCQLTEEFTAVASSFSETFDFLSKRVFTQKIILWSIAAFVIIGLIISHIIYFKFTTPAREWLIDCMSWFASGFSPIPVSHK